MSNQNVRHATSAQKAHKKLSKILRPDQVKEMRQPYAWVLAHFMSLYPAQDAMTCAMLMSKPSNLDEVCDQWMKRGRDGAEPNSMMMLALAADHFSFGLDEIQDVAHKTKDLYPTIPPKDDSDFPY